MNKRYKKIYKLSLLALFMVGCSDFEDVNKNPNAADANQVRVEYAINKSITDAQQDPEVAAGLCTYLDGSCAYARS